MRDGLLQEAMRQLPISDLWRRRGWAGVPSKSCHFPGEDCSQKSKAACSIFVATTGRHAGLQLFKDHRAGKTFDGPGLLAAVEGLSNQEACRLFIELAGVVKPLDSTDRNRKKAFSGSKSLPPSREELPKASSFDFRALNPRSLDAKEVEAVATTRGVSVRAIESLMRFGVIHAVTLGRDLKLPMPREVRPINAWALHAHDWCSFRVRAFVGLLPGFDGQANKSLTPSGAGCSHPVWIGPQNARRVLIVEGEGDAIGAVEIALREGKLDGLAVVVIFSASIGIPSSFLLNLEGRRVRIIPHCGDSKNQGAIAACRWAATVKPWVENVEIYSLGGLVMPDGRAVGDLGDLACCSDNTLRGLEVTTW